MVKVNSSGLASECLINDDTTAVEVGAGTGAVGLMAAALGASVLLTDRCKPSRRVRESLDALLMAVVACVNAYHFPPYALAAASTTTTTTTLTQDQWKPGTMP